MAALTACGMGGPMREDKSATGYRTGNLPLDRWTKTSNDSGADQVYNNPQTASVLAVTSLCERYAEARLESLAKQLMSPLSAIEIIKQERKALDGREALWSRVHGKLDGVPVESLFVVYRKNNCVFDFQLHARDALPPADEDDFVKFVQNFRFAEGPGDRR